MVVVVEVVVVVLVVDVVESDVEVVVESDVVVVESEVVVVESDVVVVESDVVVVEFEVVVVESDVVVVEAKLVVVVDSGAVVVVTDLGAHDGAGNVLTPDAACPPEIITITAPLPRKTLFHPAPLPGHEKSATPWLSHLPSDVLVKPPFSMEASETRSFPIRPMCRTAAFVARNAI